MTVCISHLSSQLNDADITMLDKDGNRKGVVMNNAFRKNSCTS